MWYQLRNYKFYIMIVGDSLLFTMALVMAYLVLFECRVGQENISQIKMILPYLIAFKLLVFSHFGLYRGMWRYTSMADLWHLVQASLIATLGLMFIGYYFFRYEKFSIAIFLLDGIFTFLFTGAYRVFIRFIYSFIGRDYDGAWYSPAQKGNSLTKQRTLIVGAGDAGEKLVREIFDSHQLHHQIVGFVDDDPKKKGRAIHGVRVLGPIKSLFQIVKDSNISEVLIAIPSAGGPEMRRIMEICKECDVQYKTIPGLAEIIDGRVSVKALRDINYEDLLGREPVHLDNEDISGLLTDRVVLVTGAGGSIGSELCRQVVTFKPRALILLDFSEPSLFQIQTSLYQELRYQNHLAILGQVQDRVFVDKIFQKYRPEVVLHAAAYKHVPMLEKQPWKAVDNNILGSQVIMEAAVQYGVAQFVLVSTDKAVRPTNVMGASKRVSELLLQSFSGSATQFVAVRFGNVVGSSGSVVPLFRRQIEKGGPVTVTHPEVTRYFMTIPEASQLILQAACLNINGGIFVLKMGMPIRIVDMAKDLIHLSGKEPGKDIQIEFTGLREGEKLYEELLTEDENIVATKHDKIMWMRSNGNGFVGYDEFRSWLSRELNNLYQVSSQFDAMAIKEKLKLIVPEYNYQEAFPVL